MNHPQLDVIVTKISALLATVFIAGSTLNTIHESFQTLFAILACFSTILIIAVNWDKGVSRIIQGIKSVYQKDKSDKPNQGGTPE